ncbi:site-2 protease family protein [Streptomyces sp. S.PNR 29]|uniref:site-2 protease family protein n=1 Tax=Streptomyces sp. S.PNR 29 TaxID=2973805 RepID=UPI0025B0F88A|nr:site-2 protease family protein [Streptomyces sp. S.PNR 29]MDN0196041.1 site-2 protease family protein [Streptomyces sp. S.PNR 29]
MDESGRSGQPRSGNDEPAERHAGSAAPATGFAHPDPDANGDTAHRDDTGPAPATATPAPADERRLDVREEDAEAGAERNGAADNGVPGNGTPGNGGQTTPPRPDQDAPADGHAPPQDTGGPAAGETREAAPEDTTALTAPRPPQTATPPDAPADAAPGPAEHGTSGPAPHAPAAAPADTTERRPAAPAPDHRASDHTPGTPDPGHSHDDRAHAQSGAAQGRPPRPPEPRGGLLMGRPFGVPVYVAPSWFLVAALITWVFGGQLDRVLPELGAARYLVSLFFAVAFYASVLVHELAHTVAALRFKLPVRRIQLQFFGGVSEIEKEAETPGREFVLAFVGPLLSLVLAGVFYLALLPIEPGTVPGVLLAGLMISNLIVAAFNLLPGLPLDGGRMLRAVVWKITGKPMAGTIAAAWVGRALAVLVLIGLPLLTQSGALGSDAVDNVGMDTVMDALLAAILAAIIWTGAGNSLRMARLREHLPELRARALTRRAVPVETDTPLSEALRRANAAGARALVVVDAEGNPLSLVREAAIVQVPEHRRPWVAVSGLAQELTDGMRVSAELAGEELLDALRATPATEYLVVEETGAIYGVLSAADVERAFVKAMARPS